MYFLKVFKGSKCKIEGEGEKERASFKSWRSSKIESTRSNSSSNRPFSSHCMFWKVDSGRVRKYGVIVDV